jgi:hypothetical protein
MLDYRLDSLDSDRAENSIMQTITIAVSAILIASGLVTAPGLINNARDGNTRNDLANVAYTQSYIQSDTGKYAASLAELKTFKSIKLTLSDDQQHMFRTSNKSFAMFIRSKTGDVWMRSSGSTESYRVSHNGEWTEAPNTYPADLEYPTQMDTGPNLSVSPNFTTITGVSPNNAAMHAISYTTVPEGHPTGTTTGLKSYAVNPEQTYVTSLYNVDGLRTAGYPRTVGLWVYVTSDNLRVYDYSSSNTESINSAVGGNNLKANTWTYVSTTKPISADKFAGLFVRTIDGKAVKSSDAIYITGVDVRRAG